MAINFLSPRSLRSEFTRSMKKAIPFALLFTFLFYQESAGVNFLIFTILLLVTQIIADKQCLSKRSWLALGFSALFTALFCFIHASSLAAWMNIISLMLLSAFWANGATSTLFQFAQSLVSFGGVPGFAIVSVIDSFSKKEDLKEKSGSAKKILFVYVLPFCCALIFFFIYKDANPIFAVYTKKLNLDFISGGCLLFFLAGCWLMYGFFKSNRITALDNFDRRMQHDVQAVSAKSSSWNEAKALRILFVLLNGMMLFITVLDVKYLYLEGALPDGITHKQFVHNGVGMLMLSVVLGIALLLWFFRGALNFTEDKGFNKGLVGVWIVLNVFMVFSTGLRNFMYVHDGLLTYKRAGVYLWLFFAFCGLALSLYKIVKNRSNWFLVKANFNVVFATLVLLTAVDWDRFISSFNIKNIKQISILDKKYLLSLSETNIAQLYSIRDSADFMVDSSFHYQKYFDFFSSDNRNALDKKLFFYLNKFEEESWSSFSVRRNRVATELNEIISAPAFKAIDLNGGYAEHLNVLFAAQQLLKLNLSSTPFRKFSQLQSFPQLIELNIDECYIETSDSLPQLKQLRSLSLARCFLKDIQSLNRFQQLEELDISANSLRDIDALSALKKLKQLNISSCEIIRFDALKQLVSLESLIMNSCKTNSDALSFIPSLKTLSLADNAAYIQALLADTTAWTSVKTLNLQSNKLFSLGFLERGRLVNGTKYFLFPHLNDLKLEHNSIYTLKAISGLKELKWLFLSDNQLESLREVSALSSLVKLDASFNRLRSVNSLDSLINLNELNLSDNPTLDDFGSLHSLKQLKILLLKNTGFTDLSLLSEMKQLKELDISKSRVRNFESLRKLSSIETLSISSPKATDATILESLKKLKELKLYDTEEKAVNEFRKRLKTVRIRVY